MVEMVKDDHVRKTERKIVNNQEFIPTLREKERGRDRDTTERQRMAQ